MRGTFIIVLLSMLGTAPGQIATQEQKCSIEGRVTAAATGEPLRRATVILRTTEGRENPYSASTDPSGRYVIPGVEPGRYRLYAQRDGFVRQEYGQKTTERSGVPVVLSAGQDLKTIDFQLIRSGVISGRVTNEDGEPAPLVRIQGYRRAYVQGRRQLMPVGMALTNDLGEYRLFGLQPGSYYVSAVSSRNTAGMVFGQGAAARGRMAAPAESGYPPLFYPNALDVRQAAQIQVTPGGEARGTDFRLLPTSTVRLRGRIDGLPAEMRRQAMITLVPREELVVNFANRTNVRADPQGNFEIRGVVPGDYTLAAEVFQQGKRQSARRVIQVGTADLDDIVLTLASPVSLSGYIRTEGEGTVDLSQIRVYLQPLEPSRLGGAGTGEVRADGLFVVENVVPGRYQVYVIHRSDEFYLKSVRMGNQEIAGGELDLSAGAAPAPLELVLRAGAGQVSGMVMGPENSPALGVTVVAVPEESRRNESRLYKSVASDQSGQFTLKGLVPGEYKLFAWEEIEPGAYQDPEFLKPFESRGKAITVAENGREAVQLQMIPADTR